MSLQDLGWKVIATDINNTEVRFCHSVYLGQVIFEITHNNNRMWYYRTMDYTGRMSLGLYANRWEVAHAACVEAHNRRIAVTQQRQNEYGDETQSSANCPF